MPASAGMEVIMKKRKLCTILLAVSLLFGLCLNGCSSPESAPGDSEKSAAEYEAQIQELQAQIRSLEEQLSRYEPASTEPPAQESEIAQAPSESESPAQTQEQAESPEETQAQEGETSTEDHRKQIVVFGDSIWDSSRDESGIAYLVSQYMDADVYNCAIGGTRATMKPGAPTEDFKNWDSTSLSGMVHAAIGDVDPEQFLEGYVAGGVFMNVDFSKTDYFIISYGLNDYFAGAVLNADNSNRWDTHGYGGALRMAIDRLRKHFPNAQILLISPTYCQFWKDGVMYTDSNMKDFGGGTLTNYVNVCQNVAETEQTLYIDAYTVMGINTYTAQDYLEDGIHLTAAGRELYAKAVSSCLKYGMPGKVSGNSIYY